MKNSYIKREHNVDRVWRILFENFNKDFTPSLSIAMRTLGIIAIITAFAIGAWISLASPTVNQMMIVLILGSAFTITVLSVILFKRWKFDKWGFKGFNK